MLDLGVVAAKSATEAPPARGTIAAQISRLNVAQGAQWMSGILLSSPLVGCCTFRGSQNVKPSVAVQTGPGGFKGPTARPDRPKNRRFTPQAASHAQSTWWCRSIGVRAA